MGLHCSKRGHTSIWGPHIKHRTQRGFSGRKPSQARTGSTKQRGYKEKDPTIIRKRRHHRDPPYGGLGSTNLSKDRGADKKLTSRRFNTTAETG